MTSPITFDGGLVCALGVKDLNASLQWYEKTLGFRERFRLDGYGWAEIGTPVSGVTLGLSQVESPEVRGGVTPTFGVTDIEAARAALETQGVAFDGPIHTIEGQVKLTTFFDPDGNKLMFSQSLAQ
jgi:catechol 2,3-dioxygenase-like lactoylglutathione lyase family enzyme